MADNSFFAASIFSTRLIKNGNCSTFTRLLLIQRIRRDAEHGSQDADFNNHNERNTY
jgi:hypothetical protein